MGWTMGPQQLIDDARYAKLTAKTEARVVERWLAVEWKPADEAKGPHRRNAARRPSPPSCGVTELTQLAPGVPFAWAVDASGIAVPELRLTAATKAYLERAQPSV